MGVDNSTMWRYFGSKLAQRETCMMMVRKCYKDIEIIIPDGSLNQGLTSKDVARWVEIGNSLLFPASTIHTQMDRSELVGMNYTEEFKQFYLLDIECDTTKEGKYLQGDARHIKWAKVASFNFSLSDILGETSSVTHRFHCFPILVGSENTPRTNWENNGEWNGNVNDYRLRDTKENLKDYIVRKCSEIDFNAQLKEEVSLVRLPLHVGSLYATQKLAMMSFYRYLYSNMYDGIVKDTLHLVDLGVDPWQALYAAMSRKDKNYSNYYHLLLYKGYNPMEIVQKNLNSGRGVNDVFSVAHTYGSSDFSMKWSDDDQLLLENLSEFVKVKPVNNKYICIRPTKTLVKDAIYQGTITHGKLYVKGTDWITREYSAFRFQKAED